ncbi:MAG: response regulator [Betaproteobacteria bacterium]|nr:response regulator [Betaproteobacteria bacterium]
METRKSVFAWLRSRLQNRPDTEHEQALVRLALGLGLGVYLLVPHVMAENTTGALQSLLPFGAFVLISLGIFCSILVQPGVSHVRRVVGAMLDSATVSYFMVQMGVDGLLLYVVYLWIIIGNGFRYGRFYLLNTLVLSVIGFSLVLMLSDFWHAHVGAGISLVVGMVGLSLYSLTLVKRLLDAVESAEAANKAKRRFVSTVSHEMRTPLNAIIGMTELLRDTQLGGEQSEMVRTIGASSRAMLGLVDDVLDFSKIEAGKLTVAKEDFDLYALVNGATLVLRPQAERKGLSFVVSIMPDVPPYVRGDPIHLRQVLINLLGNAVKFTDKGGVTLHVSRLSADDGVARLKFSIRDTGMGIAPEHQRQIFESFTQADQSVTRKFGGTGLGTTISKQLVELMGGQIGLESAVGLGSTFWLELDFEPVERALEAESDVLFGVRVLLIGFPMAGVKDIEAIVTGWGGACMPVPDAESAASHASAAMQQGRPFQCGLLYAETSADADTRVARLFRLLAGERLPLVLCAPEGADVHRMQVVQGHFGAALPFPLDKRLLYNALHSFTAEEPREGVVFISDYLRRKEPARALNILVADDNATNRAVLGKMLERAGFIATMVENGDQALDALEGEQFDVVLLDRNMPVMGGVEAVRALRALEAGQSRTPVIILSADVTEEARQEALANGADAFLTKPIQAARLLDAIAKLSQPAEVVPQVRAELPAAETAPGLLNYETLGLLEGLGSRSDFMEKLIRVFSDDNAALIDKMEEAVAAKRFGELRSLLHALKGSAGSIGADDLARTCSRIHALTEVELRARGLQHVGKIRADFDLARAELTAYLQKRKSGAL